MNIQRFLFEQLKGFEWPEKLTLLVCGGRDFADVPPDIYATKAQALYQDRIQQKDFIWTVIDLIDIKWLGANLNGVIDEGEGSYLTIVNGAAGGADRASSDWVKQFIEFGCAPNLKEYPANWKKHGKSAESIRNQLMLYETQPHIVLAFPGGSGTADMVRKAKRRGGKVIEVPYPLNN